VFLAALGDVGQGARHGANRQGRRAWERKPVQGAQRWRASPL
jgi:hypothetical protein